MKINNFLKNAGIILIITLMVLSTVIVTGNTIHNYKTEADKITLDAGREYAPAATDAEIKAAITSGIAWLAGEQELSNPGDPLYGSWRNPAYTALVLIKLQDYAYENQKDPFETNMQEPDYYKYATNVIAGWEYLFTQDTTDNGIFVRKQPIHLQYHLDKIYDTAYIDEPDTNTNGYGIYLGNGKETVDNPYLGNLYLTGIFLTALVSSGDPTHENEGSINFDNTGGADTFGEIAQEVVDWIAFAQCDRGARQGGWAYTAIDNNAVDINNPLNNPDNSVSGYVTQGLAAAKAITARPGAKPFACTVPNWVKRELNWWIDYIQYDDTGSPLDGGSLYGMLGDGYPPNELRTGNLIFEMRFYGDNPDTSTRFKRALDFIERHWHATDLNDNPGWGYESDPNGNHGSTTYPGNYQTMFCLMKGLQYYGIDLINTDNSGGTPDVSWFNQQYPVWPYDDFASVLVDQQYIGHNDITGDGKDDFGCWRKDHYGDSTCILSTTWALLTLEKVVPLCGDLTISKDAYPSSVQNRDIITYTIHYENPSTDSSVHNVYIIDYLSSCVTYVDGSANPPPYAHNHVPPESLYWKIGTLGPSAGGYITFEAEVISPENCGNIHNTVYIYSDETPPSMASVTTYVYYESLPPFPPTINGPTGGKAGAEYDYTIVATDPEEDIVFCYVDWGDDTNSSWIGPFESGENLIVNHTWEEQGRYTIKAKAKDVFNNESEWTTFEVTMPRNKSYFNTPFLNFLQQYPLIYLLLLRFLQL